MKKIELSEIIGILANVGVIAGIVFLAIEVGQQNTVNLLSGRDAAVENFNGFRTLLLENPDLMEIWNRGTADEQLDGQGVDRFNLLCQNTLWGRLTIVNRQRALGLDSEVRGTIGGVREDVRNSEHFRRCWERTKRSMVLQGHQLFVDMVDAE